jgi:hypothetical protein
MSFISRKQLLVFGIILVTLINLSAAATYWFKKPERRRRTRPSTESANNFIAQELDLNASQQETMLVEQKAYFAMMRTIQDSIRGLRRQMFRDLAQNQPDTAALAELAARIGGLQAKFETRTYRHILSLAEICTPEQKEVLAKIIKKSSYRRMPGRRDSVKSNQNPGTN